MTDFTALNQSEIDKFVFENQRDMGSEGFEMGEVASALKTGKAVVEVRSYGVALIELKPGYQNTKIPHLWAFFVNADQRGIGLGSRFMRELLRKYSSDNHMSLWCEGPRRRKFFGRFGFRIEDTLGVMRRMTTNPGR